jgi:hypothetical protein
MAHLPQSANSDVHPKINWSPISDSAVYLELANLIGGSAHHFSPQNFRSHSLRNVHHVSVCEYQSSFFGNFMETLLKKKCNSAQAFSINSYKGLKFEPVLGGSFVFIRTHVSELSFFFNYYYFINYFINLNSKKSKTVWFPISFKSFKISEPPVGR